MSSDTAYRNIDGGIARVAFSVLLLLLLAALLAAFMNGHVFWSLIAIWIFIMILTPEFGDAILSQPRSLVATMAVAGLFVLYLFLGPAHPGITDLDSLLWTVPGNLTIFSLVQITLLIVNERGHGHMVQQFMMAVTLISYMTVVLLQGPIDHYAGMLLGKAMVPGNNAFMRYFIFSTAVGVFLTYVMVNYLRMSAIYRINPDGVEWRS